MTSQRHHKMPVNLPPANCFTILVVDDLQSNRVLLGRFFKTIGYSVVEASTAVEALDMLMGAQIQPQLIVTDVEMPVMSGIDMVQQIRFLENGAADLPIIVASGNPSTQMEHEAFAAGADLFLAKPFDLGNLRKEVARLFRAAKNGTLSRGRQLSPNQEDNNRLHPRNEVEN